MERAQAIAASEPSYFTDQVHNADSVKGYKRIGEELVEQVGGAIHAFCASVGTAAMLMGVTHILRRLNPPPRIIALEPASTPMISKGISGTHHVEGIFAGASSEMNVLGALALARELGVGHTVVTVAVDSGLKYLAGDLYGQESS